MKKFLLNLLPLSCPGKKIHKYVHWLIGKINKCPNCGSLQFKRNRLRCFSGGHWFCLDCSIAVKTAVDCPICNRKNQEK